MSVAVRTLFQSRTESFFDVNTISIGVVSCICEALQKYDLLTILKHGSTTVYSLRTQNGKIVKRNVSERQEGIWSDFCSSHPNLKVAQDCLNNVHPYYFWSLANQYPNLVKCLHTQVRLMCNFGFNEGVPWLRDTNDANCFICKHTVDDNSHFILNCPSLKDYFALLWHKLKVKVHKPNPVDGSLISNLVDNLDQHSKMLLPLWGLPLPFDQMTVHTMRRFITSAVGKIYNIRTERLREVAAPWLSDKLSMPLLSFLFFSFVIFLINVICVSSDFLIIISF